MQICNCHVESPISGAANYLKQGYIYILNIGHNNLEVEK